MTRSLVIFAHPCHESFSRALFDATCGAIKSSGHEVDIIDLYAEGFQPVLTAEERRTYHEIGPNLLPVKNYVERLQAADRLIFVFPVWNFGYPAILKGFLDRVFLPGVSFALEGDRIRRKLTNIRHLAAVTTYGASRLQAVICGDPPRRSVTRHVRMVVHPRAKVRYLALYGMNQTTQNQRDNFLSRVIRVMGTW
ncbi:MAG: NAD(P)H-dependent oxidoreductase [Aestuariivita sp.]|nr:NAD(P)H-dependent oxidoreductase [Aestuariivita sp.]MCY4203385.1 NAD(P)H-dependent oxidoreductase [Aestuariivita sp.]MCY4289022.1 NAD(P)H-dependent oxidoreductase [Aestuariivita sp.]MCY4347385.1 NAD(P)H-dependent oxidoreductase [Aestuariivita sp.]